MQPVAAETNEKKSGLRKPPKYEIKADSFQSIQLKPVSRDPKTPQKAENGGIELKVFSREGDSKYICSIYIYISFSFALFLSHLYVFISFPSNFSVFLMLHVGLFVNHHEFTNRSTSSLWLGNIFYSLSLSLSHTLSIILLSYALTKCTEFPCVRYSSHLSSIFLYPTLFVLFLLSVCNNNRKYKLS